MLILSPKFFSGSFLPNSVLHTLLPILASTGNFTDDWGYTHKGVVAGRGCFRGFLCARSHLAAPCEKRSVCSKALAPWTKWKILWLSSHYTMWLPNWLLILYCFTTWLFCFSCLFILCKIIVAPWSLCSFCLCLFIWMEKASPHAPQSSKPCSSFKTPTRPHLLPKAILNQVRECNCYSQVTFGNLGCPHSGYRIWDRTWSLCRNWGVAKRGR